jgi:phosphopantothenoylcysteine decarboxylase / phosphopantothenate---cysteine ligase
MLKNKKIVLGITGSIAAYKIPFLIRLLVKEGAEVRVILSPAAVNFVTPLTLSTLSKNTVIIDPFQAGTGEWNNHVALGMWADLMVFAPVTANTLGKMVNGIADNFLITAYLSAKCPVLIAPAMDLDMYNHPSTQKNITILKSYGNTIIEPQVGELASGLSGPGRMEEPERLLDIISAHFEKKSSFAGKKFLVTAGPTYESIDPVRFIGNHSSGKMGFAIAEEACRRGASVTLVTGPSSEIHYPGIHRIDVISADEMLKACTSHFPSSDVTIMAAAVADYTPANVSGDKMKKSLKNISLELKPTADILKKLGSVKKPKQVLVGFALETKNDIEGARKKLTDKNLDLIVLNSLGEQGSGFNTQTNKVTLIEKSGKISSGKLKDKREVAADILDAITLITGNTRKRN